MMRSVHVLCLVGLCVGCGAASSSTVRDEPTIPTNEQAANWVPGPGGVPVPADAIRHHGDGRRTVFKLRRPHDEVRRGYVEYLTAHGFQIELDSQQGEHFLLDVTTTTERTVRRFTLSLVREDANTTTLEIIAE